MTKLTRLSPFVVAGVVLALSGCAVVETVKVHEKASAKQDESKELMAEKLAKSYGGEAKRDPIVEFKDEMFLSSRSMPTSSDQTLPAMFNRVVLRFPGRYTVAAIGERITKETNIPVTLAEDLAFAGGGGGARNISVRSSGSGSDGSISVLDPFASGEGRSVEVYRNTPNAVFSEEFELDYVGSLAGLLDLVAAKGRISWEYRKGVIHFSKRVSKTFYLNILASSNSSRSIRASVGASSGGGAPAGNGSINTQNSYTPLDDLASTVESLISPIGKISVNKTTNSITVTDVADVVDRVGRLIESENRMLGRQVRIRVDFLNVRYESNSEAGIDIGYTLSSIMNAAGDIGDFTQRGNLARNPSSGSSVYTLKGTDYSLDMLLQALNTVGKTSVVSRKAVTTLNRQPAPIVVSNQTTYLAQTTAAVGGVAGAAGGAPGLTPGVVNTGLSMEILPVIMPDNSLLVQLGLDISELINIEEVSTGEGESQQKIQTPEVSTMSFLERVAVQNGETIVLVGYEREIARTGSRDALSALSSTGSENREAFIVTLTPYLD